MEEFLGDLFPFDFKKIPRFWATKKAQTPSLRQVFERFRDVLRSNNKALEIIADLGEKLSGDYVFDRRYIETSTKELVDAVYQSVEALNVLRPSEKELYQVHKRLADQLQTILAGGEDRQGPRLLFLDEIDPLQWAIIGGKNTHLAEIMRHLAVHVPPGFVITTRTYHDLLDYNGILPLVKDFEASWPQGEGASQELETIRLQIVEKIKHAKPPPGLLDDLKRALNKLTEQVNLPYSLAVRSSAQEEDLDFSFAGQFQSVLNVSPLPEKVFNAYLDVVASLFSNKAVKYRQRLFPDQEHMSIACGCQIMVDSQISGVMYSTDPAGPGGNNMVIVAAWGQAAGIVEGKIPTDFFVLDKNTPADVIDQHIGDKQTGLYLAGNSGIEERPVPADRQRRACLDRGQLQQLAEKALMLENYFKRPQDIEWTFDRGGILHILQSRPLLQPAGENVKKELPGQLSRYEILVESQGQVAQQGIGTGPVFLVHNISDLADFPDGAVLVSPRDSSRFVQVMHRAAAIITEVGTPVSHMATLCRELQVPCLVNVPNIMNMLENGQIITVDAEDRKIYQGRVKELLTYQLTTSMHLGATSEFRLLKRLLNNVSRLHLVDPLLDRFTPDNCRTFHDLLRYIHESAVITLVNVGKDEKRLLRRNLARHLDLPIPAGIMVIDINGGLHEDAPLDNVPYRYVTSIPFRAILQGMLYPEVWHRVAMQVCFKDMMSSMLSAPPDTLNGRYTGHNIAIISENYVNLCFRFGYHFNIIDAHCDEVERDNHIYFRFLGGATDMIKRSRRSRLIAEILDAFDFNVRTKGDLVIARAGNMVQKEMERSLDILGRLVAFTRQLDVCLDNDAIVDDYVEAFLQGNYAVVNRDGNEGKNNRTPNKKYLPAKGEKS